MLRFAVAFLAASSLLYPQARIDSARVDAIVEAQLKERNIPGVAVALVSRDSVYTHGYGVRNLQTKVPVTPHTLFTIGSVTKSMTALGAALLVDEGKLDWDKPVREYLPWFRMYDPIATELTTIRDLLTHRSGVPRYDFLRYAVPLPREEIVRRLRHLQPTASFRSAYQYQNLMYTAAGYLAGALDGTTWEEMTEKRVFEPLGMTDSTLTIARVRRHGDFASPHLRVAGALKPVPFYDYQFFGVGPNGAANSSAADMARYLRFHLGDGTIEGKRVLSKRQFDELHRTQVVIGDGSFYVL